MMVTLKRAILIAIVVVGGFYALRLIGGYQSAATMAKCMPATSTSQGKSLSEEEVRAMVDVVVACVQKKNGFIGKLFFDANDLKRNFTYSNS